jgi:hypothetical protein
LTGWAAAAIIGTVSKRSTVMRKFKFIMDNQEVFHVVARDFRAACLAWEQFGKDPRDIWAIEQTG